MRPCLGNASGGGPGTACFQRKVSLPFVAWFLSLLFFNFKERMLGLKISIFWFLSALKHWGPLQPLSEI